MSGITWIAGFAVGAGFLELSYAQGWVANPSMGFATLWLVSGAVFSVVSIMERR